MSLERRMWQAAGLALCEVDRRDRDGGLHPCGLPAGHDGDHACAIDNVCRATWGRVEIVVSDHLGPCAECGDIVRAGDECSECLEEDGVVVHDTDACCEMGNR